MRHWFIEKIAGHENSPAIAFADQVFSYKELSEQIDRALEFIEGSSICSGEAIAIVSDYSFHSVALFFALMNNRNIVVPITSKVEAEINERLSEGYCKKAIYIDNCRYHLNLIDNSSDKLHPLLEDLRNQEKAGLILFSSGSTGKPKAMILDLTKIVESYRRGHGAFKTLVFLMFDHIGGVNTLFHILSSAGFAVFTQSRDAEAVCQLIDKYKVELLPSSPTFLNLILISEAHLRHDLSSLKLITYGTEAMPESLLKRLKDAFPGTKLKQTFGTSETGILSTKSKSDDSLFMKLGGRGFEHKVIDGELYIRSNISMLGYLNAENPFTEDGWFPTGDLVEVDEDGYIKIIGRLKEVINVGGEKVLPAEVESVLLEMPGIVDVMAYGEQNAITGQNVCVDVVLLPNIDAKQIKRQIRAFCKDKIDDYKIPTRVNVVEKVNFGERFKKIRRK